MTGPRFNYEPKTYRLTFEDMPGLEVVMRSASVGQLLDISVLADQYNRGSATAEQVTELFTLFGGRLQSWNLDVDGDPVPATADGVRSLDGDLFMAIFRAWFEGMTRAPKASTKPAAPSGLTLTDLPMAPLRAV